jgi:hypothetical protein
MTTTPSPPPSPVEERNLKVWIALDPWGKPRAWTIATTRKDAMQSATETMMGATEYHRLETLSKRWAHCYRRGCRIVRAAVKIDP